MLQWALFISIEKNRLNNKRHNRVIASPDPLVGRGNPLINCHSRAGGNLLFCNEWIPACAGMTI